MAIRTVRFDFDAKTVHDVSAEDVPAVVKKGQPCWIDIEVEDEAPVRHILEGLAVPDRAILEILGEPAPSRNDTYNECTHLTLSATRLENDELGLTHVEVVLGESFILTLRREPVELLTQIHATYRQDFEDFAASLGFLLFMLWSGLIDNQRKTLTLLETEVDDLQAAIFRDLEDELLTEISRVTQAILGFRKIVLGERDVLHDLSSRKSRFVSESTQPYLQNLVGRLDRLGDDLAVEREVMAETFNIHLGLVSHRTNRVVNRLTVLSMVFLPLSFICGVYGMNFEHFPELKWPLGYPLFWLVTVVITVALLLYVRAKRWL